MGTHPCVAFSSSPFPAPQRPLLLGCRITRWPTSTHTLPWALFREVDHDQDNGHMWAELEKPHVCFKDFYCHLDSFTTSHPLLLLQLVSRDSAQSGKPPPECWTQLPPLIYLLQVLYNTGKWWLVHFLKHGSTWLLRGWVHHILSCLSETAFSDSFPAPISLKNILEPNISLTISIYLSVLKPTTESFWVVFKFESPWEPWDFLRIPTPCSYPSDENCILNVIYKVGISVLRPKIHSKLQMQWLITTKDDGYKKKKKRKKWHIQKFNLKEIQHKRQGDRKNRKQNVPAWYTREWWYFWRGLGKLRKSNNNQF